MKLSTEQSLYGYRSLPLLSGLFFLFSVGLLIFSINLVLSNYSAKTCQFNGQTYQNGEGFTNDCNSCLCEDGKIACTAMACDESTVGDIPEETNTSCLYRGTIYENNSNFPSPDDTCNTCTCNNGNTTCTEMNCFE